MNKVLFNWLLFSAWAGAAFASLPSGGSESTEAAPAFRMEVLATGLTDPDGLAIHPQTGEIYVSEETAGRISVLRNGRAEVVVGPDIRVEGTLPDWMITRDRPDSYWRLTRLRNPEGICFMADGTLLVAEDTPGGRLLAFSPDAAGRYGPAAVVPIPHLGDPYAWESVSATDDGRIYLAGASHEGGAGLGASCVIARDPEGTWWMVDYSPLASFSAVATAPHELVLAVGDESVGGVTWWDVEQQREIVTLTRDLASIEGLAFMPDGSLVVAQENTPTGGRLVRLDPASGRRDLLAEGLGTLESLVWDSRGHRLLAVEDSTGRILVFTPSETIGAQHLSLLDLAKRSGNAKRGVPPRAAPDFLKQFFKAAGVQIVDQSGASDKDPPPTAAAPSAVAAGIPALTLEELGRRIPLVAGRLAVDPIEGVADPVVEISFVNLFPNQLLRNENRPMPGLCFYAARHRSGRVERSRVIEGMQARRASLDGAREWIGHHALLMLPLTTCTAVESDNGVTVSMTFLGLERFDDSFLTLHYGRHNYAYFSTAGEELKVARASFTETKQNGVEMVNFAMAGVRPRRAEDAVWLRLSTRPNWSLLSPAVEPWIPRWSLSNLPELVARMRRFNQDVIDGLLADDAPPAREKMAGRDAGDVKDEKTAPDITGSPDVKDPGRADVRPIEVEPPLARIQFAPPPLSEEERLLTNLILSRVVQAWNNGAAP